MALTDSQKVSALDKKSLGKSSTDTARDFFEEPYNGRAAVFADQVWNQVDQIPTTAPVLAADAISGVVQYKEDLVLAAVAGAADSFYHADLVDAIPFNFGDGSYNYTVKDSLAGGIAFGQNDWRLDPDTGTLTFYGGAPANMPPSVSFYKYVGTKGVGSGSGGGGSKNYIEGDNTSFESSIGDWITYKEGSADYVDGASGTSTITLDITSTSLAGDNSLEITKPASDVSGEGVSLPSIAIDEAGRNVGKLNFKASVDFSNAGSVGDWQIRFYDETNAAILYNGPVETYEIAPGKGQLTCPVDIESNTALVTASFHCQTTDATGYIIRVDEIELGPNGFTLVTKGLEWKDSGLVAGDFTAFGTVTNINIRHAVSAEGIYYVKGNFTVGTPIASEARMNLAAGYSISSDVARQPAGVTVRPTDNDSYTLIAVGGNSYFNFGGGTSKHGDANGNFMGNGEVCYIEGCVEIAEKPAPQILNDYQMSQKVQLKEVVRTSNYATGAITFGTFQVPDSSFKLEGLAKGKHRISISGVTFAVNANASSGTTSTVQFSTSATPGVGLIGQPMALCEKLDTGINSDVVSLSQDIELTDSVSDIYVQVTGHVLSGSPSLTSTGFRADANRLLVLQSTSILDLSTIGAIKNNEIIESNQASSSYGGTTGQWYDQDFLDLPPGEWDLFVIAVGEQGATPVDISVGISTTSGNTSPGSEGLDFSSMSISVSLGKTSTTHFNKPGVIVNSLTRYYLKTLVSAVGASLGYRYYARRVR